MKRPLQLTERPCIWRAELSFTSGTNYFQLLSLNKKTQLKNPPRYLLLFPTPPSRLSASPSILSKANTSLPLFLPLFLFLPLARWQLTLQSTLLFLPVSLSIWFHSSLLHPFLLANLTFIRSPSKKNCSLSKFLTHNLLLPRCPALSAPRVCFSFSNPCRLLASLHPPPAFKSCSLFLSPRSLCVPFFSLCLFTVPLQRNLGIKDELWRILLGQRKSAN